jgi:glycerol-3-phosphate dehydrogenase
MKLALSAYDLVVVGGGINGCGIARDAAGRGLKVALLEQSDLGSATSSASTKLIHGGLRYLEHYKFRLVREALIEREVLLRSASHLIWPMRFVLPHHKGLRPAWLIRLGLFLYDHLGGRKILPATRVLDLRKNEVGAPLKPQFEKAFEYSDCWVDDARLVVINALDAARQGATVLPGMRCVSAARGASGWKVVVEDVETSERQELTASIVVNAAGPWVSEFLSGVARTNSPEKVRLVKGSHIVVKKIFEHESSYFFQNADGRICFAIPYEDDFTLIGTTDEEYQGNPAEVKISEGEYDYLCAAVNEYFKTQIGRKDIVWSYSGVRALFDDGASKAAEATRDYVLKIDGGGSQPVMLSVFGGKVTTYRKLAEAVLEKLRPYCPQMGPAWTQNATLPGGGYEWDAIERERIRLVSTYPFLTEAWSKRLIRSYGDAVRDILGNARQPSDLGRDFGATLSEREVDYLMQQEWARNAYDVVWRRSKLGLRLTSRQVEELDAWMESQRNLHRNGAHERLAVAGSRGAR